MALIVIAADKGAPGVTTTALALAAVWPRPVLLAECDPSGADLVYRFPAASGGPLDPRRGLLTLAVAARRGLQPGQLWEHTQKMAGGLDVLTGVINAEQGAGLSALWGPLGETFAAMQGGDVIADCGRLGPDGPQYDLLARAAVVLLVTRPSPGDVIRLRDRAAAVSAAAAVRGRRGFASAVVVIADQRTLRAAGTEVGHTLAQAGVPAVLAGGLAHDPRGAELLRGEWGGRLDKTLLIRTARETAQQLVAGLPAAPDQSPPPAVPQPPSAVSASAVSQSSPAPPAPSYPPSAAQPAPSYPQPRPVAAPPVAAPPAAAPPAVAQPPAAPLPLAPPPAPLPPPPSTAPSLTQPPPPPSYGGRHSAGASGTGPARAAGPEAGPEIGAHGWITA
jgi:hypothetical protein